MNTELAHIGNDSKVHIRFRVHAPRDRKFCTKRGFVINSCPVADGIIRALGLNDAEASNVSVSDVGIFLHGYKSVKPTPPAIRDWIRCHDQWVDGCSIPKPEPARFRLVLEKEDA